MVEAIRVKLSPRDAPSEYKDVRQEFWYSIGQDINGPEDLSAFEGKLCRQLPRELHQRLIRQISSPIREFDRSKFDGELPSIERLLLRAIDPPYRDFGGDMSQLLDALTRHLDRRQAYFESSPEIRRTREKIARASGIYFSVRIGGYSSLNLDLSVSSLSALADVFDRDFDSFRIFLEAFIPQAFGDVFSDNASDLLDFSTQIPAGFVTAFNAVPAVLAAGSAIPVQQPAPSPNVPSSREKAEWLWKLANGSLVLPVILTAIIMYFGLSMLNDIRATQYDALKPVLDHQLKLLEEDRLRLGGPPQPASKPKP